MAGRSRPASKRLRMSAPLALEMVAVGADVRLEEVGVGRRVVEGKQAGNRAPGREIDEQPLAVGDRPDEIHRLDPGGAQGSGLPPEDVGDPLLTKHHGAPGGWRGRLRAHGHHRGLVAREGRRPSLRS